MESSAGISEQIEVLKQFYTKLAAIDVILCLAGIIILARWLLRTSMGRKALAGSPQRHNHMPLFVPFVPIGFWLGIILIGKGVVEEFLPFGPEWKLTLANYAVYGLAILISMIVILLLASATFEKKLNS